MNAKSAYTALFGAVVLAVACNSHVSRSPAPSTDEESIKSLGSLVPEPRFDRSYWQSRHDANDAVWKEAQRLCEQTVLANYPNCLAVSDLIRLDQERKAAIGSKVASKNEEMFRKGYAYDDARKEWLPFRVMQENGCVYAYPGNGAVTWQCPSGAEIPPGIPDKTIGAEVK